MRTTERVVFRLIRMPCCGTVLCWVNPRLPNYCPECAQLALPRLRTDGSCILVHDETATLKVEGELNYTT